VKDEKESFLLNDIEYSFIDFCLLLEYYGITTEDFSLINSGPELENLSNCVAIWEYVRTTIQ
jgi:hypothetical protein